MDISVDNDNIYTLINENMPLEEYPGTITVFDWNGNVKQRLNTDKNMMLICKSKSSLYAISYEDDSYSLVKLLQMDKY